MAGAGTVTDMMNDKVNKGVPKPPNCPECGAPCFWGGPTATDPEMLACTKCNWYRTYEDV